MSANFTPTMGEFRDLKPFRFWCQKILPLVYDDSLSYYELLCKVVDYLNATMEDVETLHGDVTNLHDAYEKLQGYVNSYFDNLDVQDEINAKLDAMASSGVLSTLMAPYIPDLVTEWLDTHITATAPIIDSSLTIAGAAADARATGDRLLPITTVPENIMFGELVDGHYISVAGEIYANSNYSYPAEYLPVTAGTYVSNMYIRFVTMYDALKQPVTSAGISSEMLANTPFVVPEGIAYIKPTFDSTAMGSYIDVNRGTTVPENILQGVRVDKAVTRIGQMHSSLGTSGYRKTASSLEAGERVTINEFPQALKKNFALSCYAKIPTSFYYIQFGMGYNGYVGGWVEITGNRIYYKAYESGAEVTLDSVEHGLTISDYIGVKYSKDNDGYTEITINTISGSFTHRRNAGYYYMYGAPFLRTGRAITDVVVTAESADIKKPIWLIGDSYFGVTNDRVMGQLKNIGYFDNLLIDGRSGYDSEAGYAELNRLLELGKPAILVWYINMNDSTTTYKSYVKLVSQLCNRYDIELILNSAPSIPSQNNSSKTSWLELTGRRYVDSRLAVDSSTAGVWYPDFLSSDNVHPSELGAQALAMRLLIDVPEIMQA